MNRTTWSARFALWIAAALLIYFPLHSLFGHHAIFSWALSHTHLKPSFMQCGALVFGTYAGLRATSRWWGITLIAVLTEIFARAHGVDVTIALAVVYAYGVVATGNNTVRVLTLPAEAGTPNVLRAAFLGVLSWSLVIWLLSLARWGSIADIRIAAFVFLGTNALIDLSFAGHRIRLPDGVPTRLTSFAWAVIVTTAAVVITKSASALDFDSLWYGVTADRLMVGEGNIFADQGLVAHVHYYPKLYEALQIPLLATGSISLIASTSALSWLLLVVTVRTILGEFSLTSQSCWLGAGLVATLPAVAGSAIDIKGELFAAWLCLLGLYGMFRFIRDPKRVDWTALTLAAVLLAPMSRLSVLPYAGVIALFAILVLLQHRHSVGRLGKRHVIVLAVPVIVSVILIALTSLRTYRLTGVFVISPDTLIDLQARLGLHLRPNIGEYRPAYRIPFWTGLAAYVLQPAPYVHLALYWIGNAWLYLALAAAMLSGWRWIRDQRLLALGLLGLMFLAVLFGYRYTNDGADGNYFSFPICCLTMLGFIGCTHPYREGTNRDLRIVIPALFMVVGFLMTLLVSASQIGLRSIATPFNQSPFTEADTLSATQLADAGLLPANALLRGFAPGTRAVGNISEDYAAFFAGAL